jgi:hypothetical protein
MSTIKTSGQVSAPIMGGMASLPAARWFPVEPIHFRLISPRSLKEFHFGILCAVLITPCIILLTYLREK